MSEVDFSKLSDDTLNKLTNNQEIDYSALSDDELPEAIKYAELLESETKAPIVEPEGISIAESGARGALQGGLLNFADEGEGAIKALASLGRSTPVGIDLTEEEESLMPTTGGSLSEIYRQGTDEARAKYEAAQEANPKAYFGGEVAGSLLVPVPGMAAVGMGAKAGTKALKLGAAGAVASGISALGSTEESVMDAPGDVALDVGKGALFGGVATPLLGVGIPTLAGKLAESAASTNFGRDIAKVFSKSARGRDEMMAELAAAKAAGASDEVLAAIKEAPRFGSIEYFENSTKQFLKDAEQFVEKVTSQKIGSGGVAEHRNKMYAKVAEEAKKADIQAAADELLTILQPGSGSTKETQDILARLSDDVLERIGSKLEIDPRSLTTKSQIQKHTAKLLEKAAVASKKNDVAIANQAVDEAKKALANIDKEKTVPVRAIANGWLEGNRVKLHTKIANQAENDASTITDMFHNPGKYIDIESDIAPNMQMSAIKDRAVDIIRNTISSKTDPTKLSRVQLKSELNSALVKSGVSRIDDSIANSYKVVPTKDPDTGQTVFVASFADNNGIIISKPISVNKNLDPLMKAEVTPAEAAKHVKELASAILAEKKAALGPQMQTSPKIELTDVPGTKSKVLSAEIPSAELGKSQLLSSILPEDVSAPVIKVPKDNTLDFTKMSEVKKYVSQQLKSEGLPVEVRDKLMQIKNTLDNKAMSNEAVAKALKEANEFKNLESRELARFTDSISEFNLQQLNKDTYDDALRAKGLTLARNMNTAASKVGSLEKANIDLAEDALVKAEQMGMKSASKIKNDLSKLRTAADDFQSSAALFDRQEMPGQFTTQLQRLGHTGASLTLKGASLLGKTKSAITNNALSNSAPVDFINKLISLNPDDLTRLANKTETKAVKGYLNAMASADGPKRKALAFTIAQQPGVREAFGLEEEE